MYPYDIFETSQYFNIGAGGFQDKCACAKCSTRISTRIKGYWSHHRSKNKFDTDERRFERMYTDKNNKLYSKSVKIHKNP